MIRFFLLSLILAVCAGADDRIPKTSARFLNAPYVTNPLGEGDKADATKASRGPRYRLDAFDCVSYVETVIALAMTNSEDDFRAAMDKMRYKDGKVSFENRNHFTSVDWIQNNDHCFSDATERISLNALSDSAKVNKTNIDKQKWFKKAHGIEISVSPVESCLPYIPLNSILANRNKIIQAVREPMIANIVVKYPQPSQKLGTDNDIVHMGFLLPTKNGLIFRHASKRAGCVADVDFFRYLAFIKSRPDRVGVNFLEIAGQ
ncbi:MAG: DUF1460 domain-containing protein [Holophagales bacterium]|jgi:hypothetical protein|nr:DUF1460 domain-containing protein [Holophagales bacterium]